MSELKCQVPVLATNARLLGRIHMGKQGAAQHSCRLCSKAGMYPLVRHNGRSAHQRSETRPLRRKHPDRFPYRVSTGEDDHHQRPISDHCSDHRDAESRDAGSQRIVSRSGSVGLTVPRYGIVGEMPRGTDYDPVV
jgi:hypothetical protein